jgi:pentatricopeptide repeat protein
MYAKCGSLTSGCQIFEETLEHDAISWNAMKSSYALHGYLKEGMQLFEKMKQVGVILC